jgi:hypothetical protein
MPTQHFHGPQSNIHPYYEHHIHPTHS